MTGLGVALAAAGLLLVWAALKGENPADVTRRILQGGSQ